jgi:hypothetical protein
MKLAEALSERKAINTRLEDLRRQAYQNALVQEALTESEARYLLRAEDVDTIRNRLVEGAHA